MKILVTGGAGFIGSHIVEHYHQQADVVVIDNMRTGLKSNLAGLKHTFLGASLTDPGAVMAAVKGVDTIFHCAAMVSVPESFDSPFHCYTNNTWATAMLLEAAVKSGVRKIVYSSSCAVYGDGPESVKDETMLPAPASPYAITKLAGEHYCQMFRDRINVTCLRYFNVFGPRQRAGVYAAAIPRFIVNALRSEPLEIHGIGEQTRDFIPVKNVVAANVAAAKSTVSGIINVGSGMGITINRLAERIVGLTGCASCYNHTAVRPGDIQHSVADITKLLATGYAPALSFDAGLADTVAYFRRTYEASQL